MATTDAQPRCSFCGKGADGVHRLVVGVDAAICDSCIRLASDAVDEADTTDPAGGTPSRPAARPGVDRRSRDMDVTGDAHVPRTAITPGVSARRGRRYSGQQVSGGPGS
ncbi:MAG: hypothetical protein ABS81_25175 [Pseudonocardia sp. SCN 72-86]|nr:MAG: hypothetical protein ABS81_25175 [Pseudonocardia sp. SCN 72-86]